MRAHNKFKRHRAFLVFLTVAALLFSGPAAMAFSQNIVPVKVIENLQIIVHQGKGIFWQAEVLSPAGGKPVQFLWDDSYYQNSSGRRSRLVLEENKKIYPNQQQRPTKIIPGETQIISFSCEDLLIYDGKPLPQPSNPSPDRYGVISIAVRVDGMNQAWQGNVFFYK